MDLMIGTHFTGSRIEISKCNQDLNHSLSKQVSSKILGSIDLMMLCFGHIPTMSSTQSNLVIMWLRSSQ